MNGSLTTALVGRSLLVVDDEELLREVLSEEFELCGARVTTAANGAEALVALGQGAFDAVIADVRMPGGDGISLVHEINRSMTPRPLVFVCSGFAELTDDEIRDLGITAVFSKPFRREKLVRTVNAALMAAESNPLPNRSSFEKF